MEIPDTLSHAELRRAVAKNPANGVYATQICVKCGAFLVGAGVDGDVRTAEIVDQCRECFEQKVVG